MLNQKTPTFVDIKKVKAMISVSTATIYRWVDKEQFPKPVKLSVNCVRWNLADIEEWLADRMAQSA